MVSVLCVCTFNRTRSVMTAALLAQHLADEGVSATVTSAGTRADGGLATGDTVRLLGERGIDVRGHRGQLLDDAHVAAADLIVTAERDHVVEIAGRWPAAFRRTFTLPEIVGRSRRLGGRLGGPLDDWLDLFAAERPTGVAYLEASAVDDISDPTGHDRRTWSAVFGQVDDLTAKLAKALG